jgi:hypothetical protein
LLELGLGVDVLELLAAEKSSNFLEVDLARAVLVKHLKGNSKVLLLKEHLLVHSRRQKF